MTIVTTSQPAFHHPETIQADCPCCAQAAQFTLLGIQKWPARVAAAAGLPEAMGMYRCELCLTSVSEKDLLTDRCPC